MPSVYTLVQQRLRRRERQLRHLTRRIGLGVSIFISLFFALAAIALAFAYISLMRDLPSLQTLPLLLDPPDGWLFQPTRLYDRTGQHVLLSLENPAASGRQYLSIDETKPAHISPALVKATIANADPTFWTNPGYSTNGWQKGTHPTIAQRLVSDLLLWDEPPGWRRNLRERFLAAQITVHFGRQKVLEWYLNSAKYGRWVYGAEAAARVYFGKSAADLNLAEAAMLAAVADAPALNPQDALQAALERQQQVIQTMLVRGLITVDEATQAAQTPLEFRPASEPVNFAPVFTNLVLEQLAPRLPTDRLERGGLRIITTLDYDLQLQVDCAAKAQIARLEATQPVTTTLDGSPCQAARLLPTLSLGPESASPGLHGAAVVLDPRTGQVLSLVGDPTSGLDPAHLPGHSPGSLITPFVYLTAFTRGLSPASLVWDIPPNKTATGEFHGPVRLRTAFANDYLVPAVQTLTQIGPENVWRAAQQFGLISLRPPDDALQGGEITLLEGAQAFGVFANQGILTGQEVGIADENRKGALVPITVLRLEDITGKVWLDKAEQTRPVVSSQLAYLVTNVLSDETARWPSLGHPNPLEIGRPVAAKIGRTAIGNDAWTIGYTPQMVVGVWMGYSETETGSTTGEAVISGNGSASSDSAAPLWHAIIQYASKDLPIQNWATPTGITQADVCDPSGMLPTPYCPVVVSEVFLAGNEPIQTDTLYRVFQINRESGRLATTFTPPDLVEERVYMVVPPLAKEWAQQAGLPTPPDTYDVIYAPPSASPYVRITSPAMFAHVKGQVSLLGSAGGDSFAYYRLQVGAGLNPQQWLQIGQDVHKPLQEEILGTWNTEGLSGLYAVQLLVVRQNQRVETAVIQVTVDNQPPEVTILSPTDGQEFALTKGPVSLTPTPGSPPTPGVSPAVIIFNISANDDLGVAGVSFYVDDKLVSTLPQVPYTVIWQAVPGSHILRVQVADLAGNVSEASVRFTVK